MSEDIDGVIGGQDNQGEVVVIVISGKLPKSKAEELKKKIADACKGSGLSVKIKKSKSS